MLQVLEFRALCAPNLWHSRAVLQVEVAAEPVHGNALVQLISRLEFKVDSSFPTADPHFPTAADALCRLAQLLQRRTDGPTEFSIVRPTDFAHIWFVVFEIEDPAIGRATLDAAVRLVALSEEPRGAAIDEVLHEYCEIVTRLRSGRRTRHLIQAAHDRGIPVLRLDDESLLQLGQGIHRRRLLTSVTDRTSVLAETVSRDKQLCRQLLSAVGLPVVEGTIALDAEAAVRFAMSLGQSVVIKPRDADYGNGVSLNLQDPARIRAAWQQARAYSSEVIVERFQPGDWYRLLVVNNEVVAAAQRVVPKIVGDGTRTVAELVNAANTDPRRGSGPQFPLEPLRVGAVELAMLYYQGLGLDSIPATGTQILLREDAYLATGATQIDATDSVHPEVAAAAVEAAALIGLDVAGVDIISTDLSRPLREQSLAILEVNAEPAFTMHLSPYCVPSRPVPSAIVSSLFPPGQTGRVPLVAVLGQKGITSTAALAIESVGHKTAVVAADGWQLGRRSNSRGQTSLHDNLQAVWQHPGCAACVVVVASSDIEREGLPFDRSDLVVLDEVHSHREATDVKIVRLLLSTKPRLVIARASFSRMLSEINQPDIESIIVVDSFESGQEPSCSMKSQILVTRIGDYLESQRNGIRRRLGKVSIDVDVFDAALSHFAIHVTPESPLIPRDENCAATFTDSARGGMPAHFVAEKTTA